MRMLANLNKSLNMPQNVIEVFEFPATSNHSSFCLIYVTLLRAYWYMADMDACYFE